MFTNFVNSVIYTSSKLTLLLGIILFCCVLFRLLQMYMERRKIVNLIDIIPGPPSLPIVGNCIDMSVEHDQVFTRLAAGAILFNPDGGIVKGWNMLTPCVALYNCTLAEVILNNVNHINKSPDYKFLHPWLGTGLLTSSGNKWHSRRKIITPAFHFRILEDFIDVFAEQSKLLSDKLENELNKEPFDIFRYVTLCTLDIICETAMGHKLNAQKQLESEYVKAVYEMSSIVQNRQCKLWLRPKWIFRFSSLYKKHQKCIQILHSFSNKIIENRKQEYLKNIMNKTGEDESQVNEKKRLAFLDLLIDTSKNGIVLTNEDIREEVDTFMFEGHDTTSAGVCWCLYLIGLHPEIQNKIFTELDTIFGNSNRPPTMKDLSNMKYLECCIKESLRLYPSVPMTVRRLTENIRLGPYLVPSGTNVFIMTYMIHRDPKIFHQPEIYRPERFFPENSKGRHPFSYIPFSAGPRNCIGQKFAILEEKVILSTLLRKYRFESIERRENLTLLGELILRPTNGLKLKIYSRHNNINKSNKYI